MDDAAESDQLLEQQHLPWEGSGVASLVEKEQNHGWSSVVAMKRFLFPL